MKPEPILIVEDDPPTAELLKAIFEKEGYIVFVAGDGRDALKAAERVQPKLILLDLMLPDMEGYEVIRRLKGSPNTAHLPVVVLTSRHDFEEKIRGLRLGALEYLTKPFQRQELTYRIRNILDFCQTQEATQSLGKQAEQIQTLIEYMRQRHIQALIPRTSRLARLGFEYPEAAEILQPGEPGEEVETLEKLADQQLFERVFFDTVHLCPTCGHHDLNFREVCPYCETAEIEPIGLYLHRPCGVPVEAGVGARCPKCGAPVPDDGEGFPRANGYRCHGCGKIFAEAPVTCRCMNCDRIFDVEEAIKRTIYSYQLRPEAAGWTPDNFLETGGQTADSESLSWSGDATTGALLHQIIRHSGLQIIDEDLLSGRLAELIQRASEAGSSLTLMTVQLSHLEKLAQRLDQPALKKLSARLGEVLQRCLRRQDLALVRNRDQILLILPDTPMGIARIVADRIRSYMLSLDSDPGCQIALASFPEDGENAHEVLAILDAGIVSLNDDLPQ